MGSKPPSSDSIKPRRSWRYRGIRLLGCGVFCYVGVTLVLMLLENWLLFRPISAAEEWLAPPNARVEDVELHTAGGTRIHAWWCPVENWDPLQSVLLYCHGNAANLSHRTGSLARWQKELGLAILIFDYPGFGRSEGKPSEAGCYEAADAAYDWLTAVKKVLPGQVVIYGGSLGGGVAVDLASRRPHRALVLVKTFTSVPDAAQSAYPLLPARWLVRNRFDNLAKIAQCTQPVFVAHGTADHLIPFRQGERLFEAANQPKRFLAMPGIDHNDGLTSHFFVALRSFLADTAGRLSAQLSNPAE